MVLQKVTELHTFMSKFTSFININRITDTRTAINVKSKQSMVFAEPHYGRAGGIMVDKKPTLNRPCSAEALS